VRHVRNYDHAMKLSIPQLDALMQKLEAQPEGVATSNQKRDWYLCGGACPHCNCTMDMRERDDLTEVKCWNCGYENSIGEDD